MRITFCECKLRICVHEAKQKAIQKTHKSDGNWNSIIDGPSYLLGSQTTVKCYMFSWIRARTFAPVRCWAKISAPEMEFSRSYPISWDAEMDWMEWIKITFTGQAIHTRAVSAFQNEKNTGHSRLQMTFQIDLPPVSTTSSMELFSFGVSNYLRLSSLRMTWKAISHQSLPRVTDFSIFH